MSILITGNVRGYGLQNIQYIIISMTKAALICVALIVCSLGFKLNPGHNDKGALPDKLFAGEIHYSRIPVEYWEHRIQMVKALGLNALSVYVMWNYHEVEKGKFDYETENRNLSLFLDLAEKYDMKVLFRPGPYVCAEWDFGGFPARLLNIKGLVLRANNQPYLNEVREYFKSLVPIMNKHMMTPANPKGSIVLLQIENEYGFYGKDKSYIEALRKMWSDLGVDCQQYYVDWVENIQICHWTGANIGINNGITQAQFDYVRTFEKKGYLLGGEIYSGWLTHWGEKWQSKAAQKNVDEYGFLMKNNHSYSMYMVHGGSNFGLTAGANAYKGEKFDYRGHVTSYDYDAPINEQGSSTPKYQILKQLIKNYTTWSVPAEPAPIKTIEIPKFPVTAVASMLSNLGSAAVSGSIKPLVFQSDELKMFNQGFVVYETILSTGRCNMKAVVHDYALIYVDDQYVATLDRSESTEHKMELTCQGPPCFMKVIVQAMGHINFDQEMQTDFKGLISISIDQPSSQKWTMYRVPVDEQLLKWSKFSASQLNSPVLLRNTITLQEVGDTYLDASQFEKGYIWVNGRNLGRFWNKGPQSRVFCPGVWLKKGDNVVHVLQLKYDGKVKSLVGVKALYTQQEETVFQLTDLLEEIKQD